MRTLRRTFWVPIWLCEGNLNVSDNIVEEIKRLWPEEAANLDCSRSIHAYHMCDDNKCFWIFFKRGDIDHGVIAHEIWHMTCRILQQSSVEFDIDNHEPHPYLCAHLTTEVYRLLIKNRIRITL